MKTAAFKTYTGPGRICVARWAPRGTPAGFRIYGKLAPGPWFNKVSKKDYLYLYHRDILGPLDPKKTWDELHEMAAGAEPVLLCWETPPFTEKNWCHRRLISTWFEKHLGVVVPEFEVVQSPRAAAIRKRGQQLRIKLERSIARP